MQKFVKQGEPAEGRRLTFRYLCSPTKVIANDQGRVAALEAEENEMILQDGKTVAKGTGKSRRIDVDCVIYAIGDQVDASLGLPFSRGAFVTNPEKLPGDPNPAAYQPYDPETKRRSKEFSSPAGRATPALVWSASPSKTPSAA